MHGRPNTGGNAVQTVHSPARMPTMMYCTRSWVLSVSKRRVFSDRSKSTVSWRGYEAPHRELPGPDWAPVSEVLRRPKPPKSFFLPGCKGLVWPLMSWPLPAGFRDVDSATAELARTPELDSAALDSGSSRDARTLSRDILEETPLTVAGLRFRRLCKQGHDMSIKTADKRLD